MEFRGSSDRKEKNGKEEFSKHPSIRIHTTWVTWRLKTQTELDLLNKHWTVSILPLWCTMFNVYSSLWYLAIAQHPTRSRDIGNMCRHDWKRCQSWSFGGTYSLLTTICTLNDLKAVIQELRRESAILRSQESQKHEAWWCKGFQMATWILHRPSVARVLYAWFHEACSTRGSQSHASANGIICPYSFLSFSRCHCKILSELSSCNQVISPCESFDLFKSIILDHLGLAGFAQCKNSFGIVKY